MASFQVLYWQDIPAQVRVEAEGEEVKLPLDPRVQQHIDQIAMNRGNGILSPQTSLTAWPACRIAPSPNVK